MTHSLYFKIRFKKPEQVEELRNSVLEDEAFMELFNLKKSEFCIEQKNENQPFIYFPDMEDAEDETEPFEIEIETGSHVSEDDTMYALQWLYFIRIFRIVFKEQLKGSKVYYQFEDDDEERTEKEMEKAIMAKRS